MSRVYAVAAFCLVVMLATALQVEAQPCPEPGSGADGVAQFMAACTDCEDGAVTTCNDEFSVGLIDIDPAGNLVTFTYELCKLGGNENAAGLSHWVLGLDLEQFQLCLRYDMTLADLFAACSVFGLQGGMDCGLVLPDPTTQLDGVKFEAMIGDDECQTFTVTLDRTALALGLGIGIDCVVAATKAGDQDIQRAERPVPGYACVPGPICEEPPGPFPCPKSQGFWKNHPGVWPVDALGLGSETYTMEELLAIMRTPVRGDASLILARQLIAAKLNIANGSNPAPISDTITSADDLLSGFAGKLPYGVRPSSSKGRAMVKDAYMLDRYNNGELTPHCVP